MIMSSLTKGYRKISTVLIFIVARILARVEHQSRSVLDLVTNPFSSRMYDVLLVFNFV
jgi:hypothetical protein